MPIARVRLPDGRIGRFEVAEGLASEDVEQYVAGMFPQREEEMSTPVEQKVTTPATTISGEVLEVLKGLPRGAIGLLESAAAGATAILPDEAERAARASVAEFFRPAREELAPEAGYEESIGARAGEALGSTIPFLAAGPLGLAGRVAATGLGVAAGAGEARLRAEQEGGMEERGTATALGALVGATEVLPIFRILNRLPEKEALTAIDYVKRAAAAGGEEFAQEASANVAQNLIEKGLYNPEQDVFEGAAEEGAYGFGVGAFIQGLTDLAMGRRVRGAVAPPEGEDERTRLGAEQVVEGADTGGVGLPVSRVGAERPDVEGLGAAGVGLPRVPTRRLDEGEEGVQPPLEPEPARFQMEEPESWYYSALEDATKRAKVERTKPDQWLNILRQTQGVKQEEIDATGLEDWLKLQGDRTVTKQEITDYVKNNGVQVEEMISAPGNFQVFMDGDNTGISFGSREQAQDFIDESARYNVDDAVDMGVTDPEIDNLESLYDAEVARYDIKPPEEIEGGPSYANYQIPGGENYREILLTLPQKPGEQLYQSHNWEEVRGGPFKNVLAHLRVDDRFSPITGLKNNLFVQEVQSDWGQEARKFGYLPQTKEEKAADEAQLKKLETEQNNLGIEIRSNKEALGNLKGMLRALDAYELSVAFTPDNKIEIYDLAADKKLTSEDLEKIKSSEYEYMTFTPARRRDSEKLSKAVELLLDNKQQLANLFEKEKTLHEEYGKKTKEINAIKGKVPPAPFVGRPGAEGKTESWLNLSLKRALTYAAEKG